MPQRALRRLSRSAVGCRIVMDEKMPNDASVIQTDLDEVVGKLLDNFYQGMSLDPKLVIS